MTKETRKVLLDATAGIREGYIEEAAGAQVVMKRSVWVRLAAAAAVLALLVGVGTWLYPKENGSREYLPVFAIRAYAQDGTVAALESAGDSGHLVAGESEQFPGKKVFTLDISMTNADGSCVDMAAYQFTCYHRGAELQPGQSNDQIAVIWLEEDGFYGYRIVGWCDAAEYVDITIRDNDGIIVYQKSMVIKASEEYSVFIYTSYTYEKDITTQALLDKIFDAKQRYFINTMTVDTAAEMYQILVSQCGGFAELEQRPDAASLLMQFFIDMKTNPGSVEDSVYVGLVLTQDVYWNQLSEEQQALLESYGLSRHSESVRDPNIHWERVTYAIYMMEDYKPEYNLRVEYEDRTQQESDYLFVSKCSMGLGAENRTIGWTIRIYVEEPTVLRLTVVDGENNEILQRRILVTPTENGYLLVTNLDA